MVQARMEQSLNTSEVELEWPKWAHLPESVSKTLKKWKDSVHPCGLAKKLCDKVAANPITTYAGCAALGFGAGTTCQIIGWGPEDPAADVCTGLAGGVLAVACHQAVAADDKFDAKGCTEALHCTYEANAEVALGDSKTLMARSPVEVRIPGSMDAILV